MPKRKKSPERPDTDNASPMQEDGAQQDDERELPPTKPDSEETETEERHTIAHFKISFNDKSIVCERHGNQGKPACIFTHGAGGGITAPATRSFAAGFAEVSPMVCFQGSMNLPNRIKYFHATVEHVSAAPITSLGGRSMGARAAVLSALEMKEKPEALLLVSYPLMAGSKGDRREPERREQILLDLPEGVDLLFVVGSQDAQCDLKQLTELREKMKAKSWLLEVKGADHGMSVKPKEGVEAVRHRCGRIAAEWLKERSAGKLYCAIEWDPDGKAIHSNGWVDDVSTDSDSPVPKKQRTK